MKIRKLVLAAVGASVLLGSLVSASASGRSFSVDNQNLRAAFREVIFREGGSASTKCQLTLEGSLHARTIAKVLGSLIGYITRATLGPCVTGTATILTATLPWHVKYSGFQGTLPEITSVIVHTIGAGFQARLSNGITCLARTETNEPGIGRLHFDAQPSHHVRMGIEGRIRTTCLGISGTLSTEAAPNSSYVVGLGTSTPISVTLI
jgi:hypothetical protein